MGVDLRLRAAVTETPGRSLETGRRGAAMVREILLSASRCRRWWNLGGCANAVCGEICSHFTRNVLKKHCLVCVQ